MARFDDFIEEVLGVEGGYVNDPRDSGGATKWGISLRFYRDMIDPNGNAADIKRLTREDAIEIYREHFWENPPRSDVGYDHFPAPLGELLADLAINGGWARAHKTLQAAVNLHLGGIVTSDYRIKGGPLSVDGWLGKSTGAALRKVRFGTKPFDFVTDFRVARVLFYVRISPSNPAFRKGWLRRAVKC